MTLSVIVKYCVQANDPYIYIYIYIYIYKVPGCIRNHTYNVYKTALTVQLNSFYTRMKMFSNLCTEPLWKKHLAY